MYTQRYKRLLYIRKNRISKFKLEGMNAKEEEIILNIGKIKYI